MPKKASATRKKKAAKKKAKAKPKAKPKAKKKAPAKKATKARKKSSSSRGGSKFPIGVDAPPPNFPVLLKEGDQTPDFALPDANGRVHRLSNYRGKKVVLFFYPKDDTPGCTVEACDFRDKNSAIQDAGAIVLGVSPDHAVSHQKFLTKYNLSYPLLCDVEKEVASHFGAWKEKRNYGQVYWGIERTTFILDEEGIVERVFNKVQVQGHVEEVLAALRGEPVPKPSWSSSAF